LSVAKQAVAVVPDDEALLQRAAIAGLEAQDDAFVAGLLERLPKSPEGVMIRLQFYAHSADWEKLVQLAELADVVPEHERRTLQTMGLLAKLMMTAPHADCHTELERILDAAADDARALILVCDFALTLKQTDISDQAYERAVSRIDGASYRTSRSMVARTAGRREDWSTVTRLLDGYVETDRLDTELMWLLTAFANERPVRQRAVEFFKELPEPIRSAPISATAYAYMQSKRGDLREAETWFVKALDADPVSLTALLGLLTVCARQGDQRASSLMEGRLHEVNLDLIRGTPADKMALSLFLRDAGMYDRAARFAYATARANRNDPEVALRYFGLFMAQQGERMIPAAPVLAVDTWATIQNNAGLRLEVLIEDGPAQPADNLYNPTHPFVAPALGLKVGETFSQQKAIGPPETWRVVEVKHKYLHMLHEMQQFNVRFPDAHGLYYLTIEEGSGIAPVLEQVKQQSERTSKVAALYIEQHLPLAVVTGMAGGEPTGLAGYVRNLNKDIVACHGSDAERVAAEKLALHPPPSGAVLDFYTAWIAASLKLISPLKSVFGKLIVPRSVIDTIAQMQLDSAVPLGGRSMSLGYRDGQFIRQEFSEEDAVVQQRAIGDRRTEIESECEVHPVDVPDDASEVARAVVAHGGAHVLDAAFLAASDGRVLLSDDSYFRQLADGSCGAKRGMWLQPALNVARQRGIIGRAEYAEAVVGLAMCRHAHVALDEPTLAAVLEADGTVGLMKFAAVAEYIGTEAAEIMSHVSVAAKFLRSVWACAVPDLSKEAASGIILERLLRYRKDDWQVIVVVLRNELNKNYRAADYLERWLRGHFLRA
jgi:tetratricopeptide (TPR) repeat protein